MSPERHPRPAGTGPTGDLDDVEVRAEAFGALFVLHQHLSRLTDEALRPFGLTSRQWLLLAVLSRLSTTGRAPSLSEAAAAYGSSRQNVKQIALGLEGHGFLHLLPDPVDARTTRLHLTGKASLFETPDGRARSIEVLRRAFEGLDPTDVRRLRDLLLRRLAHLPQPATESDR